MSAPETALHFSALKRIARSPAHYRAALTAPPRSPAMTFGTLVHALVLGGEVIRFDGARSGNAWKAFAGLVDGAPFHIFDGAHNGKAWKAAKEEAGDRLIVSTEDIEAATPGRAIQAARRASGKYDAPIVTTREVARAERVAEAVRACDWATPLLVGAKEVKLEWEWLGRPCAGTLDVLGSRHLADLKTSASAEPEWFTNQARSLGYHAQLWWYREGARQNGFDIDDAFVVVVETKVCVVTAMRATEHTLSQGERLCREWADRLAGCEARDDWPGYTQGVVDLDITDAVVLDWGDDEEEEAA